MTKAETETQVRGCTRRGFVAAAAAASLAAAGALFSGRLFPGAASAARADEGFSASAETEAALADAQARYQAALAQIDYLNGQVFDAEARYTEITDQLNATIAQIDELQASIAQKQAELEDAQEVLAERVAASYRAGKGNMLDILLGATDFNDFISRVYYANKVSDADAQAIQDVKDIKASLEADEAALQEQRVQQEQLQAEQAAQVETLNAQVAEAESYANSLDGEVQALIAQRDAEIAAAAEAARIAAEQEAARQAAEQAAAAAGSGDAGDTGGGYVDAGGSSSGGSSSGGSSSGGGSGYQPASVVSAAYNYIGTPYSVLDCSGLTSTAYADCGYSIYHQSGVQYNTVVSKGNLVGADGLVAGNLVFYARGGSIYHVGIYIGGGMIIDSIPSGGVQVRDLYFCDGFCGGGSPL
ncbi:coiled-coil domain-containing protein [Adlercreutzia sp.]|uniref:coiled-coil domain-containing protein n=1 Tax=Adlercreutzia sp. TaxID=1872387 RepID=UPI003AEFB01B